MRFRFLIPVAIIVIVAGGAWWYRGAMSRFFFRPTDTVLEVAPNDDKKQLEIIAENLDVPWDLVFLPDNEMVVSERGGTLHFLKSGGRVTVPGVTEAGEGGLLGIVLHPKFAENQWIYVYQTDKRGGIIRNRVVRYRLAGAKLEDEKVIIANIPGAPYHDGGRMAFGPDGFLYITTGDASVSSNAQDKQTLAGKILRLHDDGLVPADNPFGTAVYSYGHRNPQGIAWDDAGTLWATEHGRSGATGSGYDEVNRIARGENYGWPIIQGDAARAGMTRPVIHSGPDETWAPSGLAFWRGRLFYAGLRGEALYETSIQNGGTLSKPRVHFRKEYGRLRAVVVGPDNALYITTSNKDDRGTVQAGDDKIIRLSPDYPL